MKLPSSPLIHARLLVSQVPGGGRIVGAPGVLGRARRVISAPIDSCDERIEHMAEAYTRDKSHGCGLPHWR